MGEVNRVDQCLAIYPVPRKGGKKCYRMMFFDLLMLALWNSYILYTKSGGYKTALKNQM
jgi:hypothetical protein